MSADTKIEWTDATWNPVTGCTKVSPGCDRCYAETFAERWRGVPGHHFERGFEVQRRESAVALPMSWRRPRRIFVNSMSDLFHADVPDEYITTVFAVMALTPQHTYQILTKRHGRMRALLRRPAFWARTGRNAWDLGYGNPRAAHHFADGRDIYDTGVWERLGFLPNVWLGVSVEDQTWSDVRVPALLDTPAAVRWISAEPLLGPVRLSAAWIDRLDWVVTGGESGAGARPMHPDWARSLRDQCAASDVPFLFKQWGAWAPAPSNYGPDVPARARGRTELVFAGPGDVDGQIMLRGSKAGTGRLLDGREHDTFPAVSQ